MASAIAAGQADIRRLKGELVINGMIVVLPISAMMASTPPQKRPACKLVDLIDHVLG